MDRERFQWLVARAIETLAKDESAYRSMSAASRRQAEKFSWKNTAEEYINYYKKFNKS